MNTAERRDIPKETTPIHTSSLHGDIEEAIRFDAIGDALHRAGISYKIEFSGDRSTRTMFIDEGDKTQGLEAMNRVVNGTEVVPDPQDDMRYVRQNYHRRVITTLAEAA